jgi:hypothetical protein
MAGDTSNGHSGWQRAVQTIADAASTWSAERLLDIRLGAHRNQVIAATATAARSRADPALRFGAARAELARANVQDLAVSQFACGVIVRRVGRLWREIRTLNGRARRRWSSVSSVFRVIHPVDRDEARDRDGLAACAARGFRFKHAGVLPRASRPVDAGRCASLSDCATGAGRAGRDTAACCDSPRPARRIGYRVTAACGSEPNQAEEEILLRPRRDHGLRSESRTRSRRRHYCRCKSIRYGTTFRVNRDSRSSVCRNMRPAIPIGRRRTRWARRTPARSATRCGSMIHQRCSLPSRSPLRSKEPPRTPGVRWSRPCQRRRPQRSALQIPHYWRLLRPRFRPLQCAPTRSRPSTDRALRAVRYLLVARRRGQRCRLARPPVPPPPCFAPAMP